ncbi:MAG: hypothetical protein KAS32_29260 [Candidatus Peribacteraceae bacterium]|nr:hypothetical protein [Candidatus Peribacteraceae bacterium]
MKNEINELLKLIHEAGLKTNEEFYRNPYNRMAIHKENPKAFLMVDKKKVPRFPVCDKDHNYSMPVIKRSLIAAKRMERRHGVDKYKDIIGKLNVILQSLSNKALLKPTKYTATSSVQDILSRTKSLGKLGEY